MLIEKDDEIRGLKPISKQYRMLTAEHLELESKFKVIMTTNGELKKFVLPKDAAESRLKELTLVVK